MHKNYRLYTHAMMEGYYYYTRQKMNPADVNFFNRLSFSFDPSILARSKALISEPFLGDPNFSRSVVLLADYSTREGAFGFIINRQSEVMVSDVLPDFPSDNFPLCIGGPVNSDSLFYVHRLGDMLGGARLVVDGLWWGGDFDEVRTMIGVGKLNPQNIRFFAGYSGWGAGQLEEEVRQRSWIITDLRAEDVFHDEPENLWRNGLKSLGRQFSIMANFPEDPAMN